MNTHPSLLKDKLYKYRPLTESLFKELYYQEIYFASYEELNDPMDLSARMDFTPTEPGRIEFFTWLAFKTAVQLKASGVTAQQKKQMGEIRAYNQNEELRLKTQHEIFELLQEEAKEQGCVNPETAIDLLHGVLRKLGLPLDEEAFMAELKRLTRKFLENSYASCFSEKNDDFLMWSHYAGKHSGICLEFAVGFRGRFPYRMPHPKSYDKKDFPDGMDRRETEESVFWEKLHPIEYQAEQPSINFFDFAPAFDNEDHCDLIGLSKPWAHEFAWKLQQAFSVKTLPWAYEKEWRAIQIHFGEPQLPEERIMHYPIEFLSAVYFGIRTPEAVKKRIYRLFREQHATLTYYSARLSGGKELVFDEWEISEE